MIVIQFPADLRDLRFQERDLACIIIRYVLRDPDSSGIGTDWNPASCNALSTSLRCSVGDDNDNEILAFAFRNMTFRGEQISDYFMGDIAGKNGKSRISAIQIQITGNV
ncbi:MAG: hypothetical protein MZV70_30850 [Desulfobacterales bacterium]|nr:hypothetical protein [Desulfobacterales bacterium]